MAMSALPGYMLLSSDTELELAERNRGELMSLLTNLIQVRSLSGETASEAQKVVSSYLAQFPYRVEESNDRPSSYKHHAEFMPPTPEGDGPFTNLIGWPEKRNGSRFAMFSHIDTHLIEEGWNTSPFKAQVVGDKLFGLGSADDKGGIAAMLIAAKILAETGKPLPVVMSLHGKGGGSRGSLPVFNRLSKSDHGIEAVLYVHPAETGHGLRDIKNAVQGIADLQLTVTGWRGPQMEIGSIDSADWSAGGNAIDMCWQLIRHLQETVFSGTEVNIGTISGGDRIGSVAEKAVVTFRLKFVGDLTWSNLFNGAKETIEDYLNTTTGSGNNFTATLETIGYRTNPGQALWDAPVSKVLRQSVKEVTGIPPVSYPNHYAGDIRYPIRLLNVPAYGIGSIAGNFYGPNEWVDINDLVKLVAVLVKTLSGWQKL